MRPRRLCLAALALVAVVAAATIGSARSAHAEAPSDDDIPTAVLGLETQDVSPRFADEIADYLRQNVANNHDLRLVPGKDLVEMKLVFACADESHTCMAAAGKSLNAAWLLYGSVKRSGESYVVWLKLFDVKQEKVSAWLTESVPREKATGPALKALTARWFAKLRGRPVEVGTLRVAADVPGAVVSLDGVPAGVTTVERPTVLTEVTAGKHVVALDKAGVGSTSKSVSLGSGEVLDLKLALAPARGAVAVGGDPHWRAPVLDADLPSGEKTDAAARTSTSRYRTGFWVTLAAGLVSAGAAVKYGLDVSQVNQDLDPYRRYTCPSGSGLCNSKSAPASPLTDAEKAAANTLLDKGNRARDLEWVFVGVGGALGIASGYLLYKGYLDGQNEGRDEGHSVARSGLRIFPTAGASSGGVLAEFDF